MKLKTATIIAAGVVAFATPAAGAPQWVEDACWYNANRVLPALNAREREAYIANCIADYTAGSPPTRPPKKRKKTRDKY